MTKIKIPHLRIELRLIERADAIICLPDLARDPTRRRRHQLHQSDCAGAGHDVGDETAFLSRETECPCFIDVIFTRGGADLRSVRRRIAKREIVSPLGAFCCVDRPVVQAVAASNLGGKQQIVVVERAHDIQPFALRFGTQIECGQPDHALDVVPCAERRQRGRIRRQRLAHRHNRRAQRFGGQESVKVMLGGQAAIEPGCILALARNRERARFPVAPRRIQRPRFGHRVDRARHVVPGERTKRRAYPPHLLLLVLRRSLGFAIPGIRRRQQLARRVVRDEQVAVAALGIRNARAPLRPGVMRRCGVGSRGAIQRVERELAPTPGRPAKIALAECLRRITLDA